MRVWARFFVVAALAATMPAQMAWAQGRVSDIRGTKHNLSAAADGSATPAGGTVPAREVKAGSESQVCVFCHTPHGATTQDQGGAALKAPLWNRKVPAGSTYTRYTSSSMDADQITDGFSAQPGGSSKLCLSCHDGSLAIGSVNVLNGATNPTIALQSGVTTMPAGSGTTTGFTRNLGTNLSNDHPISITYDDTLAQSDGELRGLGASQNFSDASGLVIGVRSSGVKPLLPLEPTGAKSGAPGQVQCATCHDPHTRGTVAAQGNQKFLRMNRFQEGTPTAAFDRANDIICLSCHDKNAGTGAWAFSAHAHPSVANEVYTAAAATTREFPNAQPVWKASCLNCHDTHTVQGSRRLLREGTDSPATPKAGGNPALEQTCYQCHASLAQSALTDVTQVPNIKNDFALTYRMPITSADQKNTTTYEAHDIGTGTGAQRGKDFVESTTLLGNGVPANRHVECTDCHNPHRVVRNTLFNANSATPDARGTHNHAAGHTNLASGVLRGTTGVEPVYSGIPFGSLPSSFDFKRGDGGIGASTAVGSAWVTREYQVCLKCHSNYAYTTPPLLGNTNGGTPSGTNGMTQYTNQAMEFQAPSTHRGAASVTDSGAFAGTPPGQTYTVNYQTRNHRSWHPVMDSTGRTNALRTTGTTAWKVPWNGSADTGAQTIYCSDCHGSSTAAGTVAPTAPNPWGPHGSTNPFILKGEWSSSTTHNSANALCIKCHSPTSSSAFSSGGSNYHQLHVDKVGGGIRCTWCHVAVPHGWKNRSFLVNLNDVGPEAGLAAGTQVRNGTTAAYNNPPYYVNALNKIRSFPAPGAWSENSCGSAGAPGNGQTGRDWMRDSNENCDNPP